MTIVIGAFDRSDEFHNCISFYRQQFISGRMRIKVRDPSNRNLDYSKFSEFRTHSEELLNEITQTTIKFSQLKSVLVNQTTSKQNGQSLDINRMIEVIRTDISDISRGLNHLRSLESSTRLKDAYYRQLCIHNGLVIKGLECHVSNLLKLFRVFLETNSEVISTFSDMRNIPHQSDSAPNLPTHVFQQSDGAHPYQSNAYVSTTDVASSPRGGVGYAAFPTRTTAVYPPVTSLSVPTTCSDPPSVQFYLQCEVSRSTQQQHLPLSQILPSMVKRTD